MGAKSRAIAEDILDCFLDGVAATAVDSASMAASVQLTSTGLNVLNGSGGKLAQFGATAIVGEDANDKSRMVLDADSLDLIVDDGGTDTTHASFGATTTIGPTATEHVEITSTSFKLKDGSTERLVMNSDGIAMGDQFSVDSSGNASFSGTLSVGSLPTGTVTGSAQLADAISGSSGEFSASAASSIAQTAVDSASVASSVQITNEGMNILNDSDAKLAEFGTNVFVGLQNA